MEISIIIPAYNAEKYIEKCVKSIENEQNGVELIIINDGSKDKTEEICLGLKEKYENINYVKIDNSGVSNARNIGISKATKDFLMFVDSDDLLAENWYEIISKNYNIISKNNIIYFSSNLPPKCDKKDMIEILSSYNDLNFAGPFSKIYNRKFLIENNLKFDCNVINGEDIIFNLTVLNKTDKISFIGESFYKYRVYFGSVTKSFNKDIFRSDLEFHYKIKNVLNESILNESTKSDILNYYKYNAILSLAEKISYIDSYKNAKINFKFLKTDFYGNMNYIMNLPKFSKKKKIILYLIKFKMYYLVYFIFEMYHKREQKTSESYILI